MTEETTTTTLPKTMIGAFLISGFATKDQRAHFELRETPVPFLDRENHPPGTLLLKTVVASICGSDFVGVSGCKCGCSKNNWRKPLDYLQMMMHGNKWWRRFSRKLAPSQ